MKFGEFKSMQFPWQGNIFTKTDFAINVTNLSKQ